MFASCFGADGVFCDVAAAIIRHDFPDLPADRTADVTAFTAHRASSVPSPLRVGLVAVTAVVHVGMRRADERRIVGWLSATRLPFLSDLPRMVRSLATAYIWERWPTTSPSGAPSRVTATGTPATARAEAAMTG